MINDERRFYDYYDAASAQPTVGKWATQIDVIHTRLQEHGIRYEGRDVLDISGGPGFLTAYIAEHGAGRAVVTEYSPVAVEGMRRHLGVEAVAFDYQGDRLRHVVSGEFDLVLIDYSINFCLNLRRFIESLTEVLRAGAVVYVSMVRPTLGCYMRWQFDEYTYNALYRLEAVESGFTAAGFKIRATMSDPSYDYRSGWPLGKRLVAAPFALWYRAKAPRGPVPFDRTLEQRSSVRLFEWPGDAT